MDNIIFKYSDIVRDDGALIKAKNDFTKLGDELIAKARQIRKEAQFLKPENVQEFDKLEKETNELLAVQKQYEDSLKRIETLEKRLATQRKRTTGTTAKQTEALRKQRLEQRQIARIQNTTAGSIENLRARLALVTNAWTKLTQVEIENTKRGQRLNESKKQLTATLLQLEGKTLDNRRAVGTYGNALNGLRGKLIGVAQAAGVTLGLFGAFRVLRNATTIVRDYEKANATLAGVLNKTKEETAELREQSQFLGSTTVQTAQDAVRAQTAYARLGFELEEILKLTPATIDGSIALNAELDETANLVGAVVNSFDDLGAADAPAIIETLAAGTTNSALTFERLAIGLPIVAGAANALNIPLEEVTATLGSLADAGIDTSTGATSLRNILIESSKRGIDYRKALDQITASTDKLSTANQLFGKRAAVSALVIANNTENVAELTEKLTDAEVVTQLVDNELNTLDGSLKLLRSAWEGYILQLNDATNGGNILSRGIRFLAENLQTIFKVIGAGAKIWLAYTLATRVNTIAKRANALSTKGLTIAQNINTIATTTATRATQAFTTALKANPLGIIIALLAAAVTAYDAFSDSVSRSVKEQERLNALDKDARESAESGTQTNISALNREFENIAKEAALRKARGENIEQVNADIAKSEVEMTQTFIEESEFRVAQLEDEIRNEQRLFDTRRKERVRRLIEERGFSGREAQRFLEAEQGRINDRNRVRQIEIDQERKTQTQINQILIEKQKERERIEAEFAEQRKANAIKRAKELAILRRRLEDLEDQSIEDDRAREIQIATRKFNREIAQIKGQTETEIKLRQALADALGREIDKINEKFDARRLAALMKVEDLELQYIKDETERRIAQEKARSARLIKSIEENEVITEERRRKLIEAEQNKSNEAQRRITLEGQLKQIEDNKKILEAKLEFAREGFEDEEAFEKFKEKQLETILLRSLINRLRLLEEFGGDAFKVEIEQLKGQIAELTNGFTEDEEPFKKLAEGAKRVFNAVLTEMERLQRGTLDMINKSIDEQNKAIDTQRRLAESGLENSLAFEQKELARREKEKLEQQQRLEKIQKTQALFQTYNNYSSDPDVDSGEALANTLRDFAVLEAIVASFGDGGLVADKVPTDGRGITRGRSHNGKHGGIPVLVEGNEGFFSGTEVRNMGRDNFYKLKSLAASGPLADNFFTPQHNNLVKHIPVRENNSAVAAGLKRVEDAIKNKPVSDFNAPEIIDGVLRFIETTTRGNRTTRNHFVIKKPRI